MPIYEYECSKCGKVDEVIQHFSDKPLTKCRYCSGKLHKLISHSSFHLKGSGWYVTDYGSGSKSTATASKQSCKSKDTGSEKAEKKAAKPEKEVKET